MFIRRFEVLLILLPLLVVLSATGRADDIGPQIDAILSQPPPAMLTAEQAAPVIQQLEKLAESAPDRRLEIEAYLIPYRRAAGDAVQAAAGTGSTPAAALKPKPLVFVRAPGMKLAIRAVSVTPQGVGVIVETPEGKKSIYQREYVETPLSWFTDTEMESGVLDLERLAARYENYRTVFPEGRAVLDAEIKKTKAVLEKLRSASRKREEEIQQKLTAVLSQTYDDEIQYTRQQLAQILLDAELVHKARPAHAVEIDQVVAPFREHFDKLLEGKILVDGFWKTKEELEAAEKKRRFEDNRLAYQKNLTIPFDALVLSESQIFQSLKMPALILGSLIAAGAILLSRRSLLPFAALLILLPTAGAVYCLFLLMSGSGSINVVRTPGGADPGKISRLLFLLSLDDRSVFTKGDTEPSFTDQDLNEFLHEHVKFMNDPGGKTAGIYVTDIAAEIVPRGFVMLEQVRYKDHFYCVRYDIEVQTRAGQPVIAGCSIRFGKALLAGRAKHQLWAALSQQIEDISRRHPLLRDYAISKLKESELQLALKTPQPAPKVEQTASAPEEKQKPIPPATPPPAAEPVGPASAATPAPDQNPPTDTGTSPMSAPPPPASQDTGTPSDSN